MQTGMDQKRCVARGAARLDKKVPGWHRMINTDQLQMSSGHDCIAGQLGRKLYPRGHRVDGFMDMVKRISPLRVPQAIRYGFVTNGSYGELKWLWLQEIGRRRDADKPAPDKATDKLEVTEKIPVAV